MALGLVDDLIGTFENESQKLKRDQEELKRPAHLRPVYYRILLTTRPFGLALCKTFDEKYLCVVLPESPSGQLGLRAGSELLSINSFAQKSEVIKLLNDEYPNQKQHNFIWMYQFPKVQYLQDNSVMPITLYLKYDPLVVLSENTDKPLMSKDDNDDEKKSGDDEQKTDTTNKPKEEEKKEESCNYWKQLQDDIYRWAVEEKYELWQVLETCNVYTLPAIQSPIIEQNIITYYHDKQNKKIVQQKLVNAQDESELRTMSSFVVEDEYYKKIGEVEKGEKIKVYCKAGAYLKIREPLNGWIKFKTEGRGWKEATDYCVKCEQQNNEESEAKESKDTLKEINKGNGDFTLFITKNYIENLKGISSVIKDKDTKKKDVNKDEESKEDKDKTGDNDDNDKDKDKEEDEEKKTEDVELADDAEYNILDLINACNNKMSVIYFMGDVDFGHTFETQQTHLNQLINLESKYGKQANFIIIRVCCVDNDIASDKNKERLKIKDKELKQFIYGRSRMEILRIYGLLHYDTGFFKYGLLLLNKDNQIIIHPKENMDININEALNNDNNNRTVGIFEKVATYILSNQ